VRIKKEMRTLKRKTKRKYRKISARVRSGCERERRRRKRYAHTHKKKVQFLLPPLPEWQRSQGGGRKVAGARQTDRQSRDACGSAPGTKGFSLATVGRDKGSLAEKGTAFFPS